MRLINVDTFRLEDFPGADVAPPYAILSHTWGKGEVSYQDFHDNLEAAQEKEGFEKIYLTCLQAKQDGLQYAWADTCCIDKNSSNELGEAINSMFKWYMNAAVCYVYLADVPGNCPPLSDDDFVHPRQLHFIGEFEESRWFTRGWTLQELIAPRRLYFFGQAWNCIGSREDLMRRVSGITNIQTDVLDQTKPLADLSIARRLSWAATRQTTRKEDEAYSLLGILDVNMPLLYGEGKKAFLRLQEEIIKQSTDQSIFAWNSPAGFMEPRELLLAPAPQCFKNASRIRRRRYTANESAFRISNKGLEITLPVIRRRLHEDPTQPYVTLGILDCKYDGSTEVLALVMNQHPFGISSGNLALELYVSGFEQDLGKGLQYSRLISIHPKEIEEEQQTMQLTITRDLQSLTYIQAFNTNEATWFPLRFTGGDPARLPSLRDVYPDQCWSESSKTMKLRIDRVPYGAVIVDTKDGVSVLICFGMEVARARNVPPEKKLFGMTVIDPNCPMRPHLNRAVRKCEAGAETASLRLNRRESVVARLWKGALTVCVENGGDADGSSVTGLPQVNSPVVSPLSPVPTSPQLYNRRPGSSHSRQGSFRKDSFLTEGQAQQAQARKDSVLSDDASSTSSQDAAPRVSRLRTCNHCVEVTEAERADQAQKAKLERERLEAEEAARKKKERNAKVIDGAKKASVGASVGGMLWDMAEFLA